MRAVYELVGVCQVDLFTDESEANSQCMYSFNLNKEGGAFQYPWNGISAWVNPPYDDKVMEKVLDYHEAAIAANPHTRVTLICPKFEQKSWYQRIRKSFVPIMKIAPDSQLFS